MGKDSQSLIQASPITKTKNIYFHRPAYKSLQPIAEKPEPSYFPLGVKFWNTYLAIASQDIYSFNIYPHSSDEFYD